MRITSVGLGIKAANLELLTEQMRAGLPNCVGCGFDGQEIVAYFEEWRDEDRGTVQMIGREHEASGRTEKQREETERKQALEAARRAFKERPEDFDAVMTWLVQEVQRLAERLPD